MEVGQIEGEHDSIGLVLDALDQPRENLLVGSEPVDAQVHDFETQPPGRLLGPHLLVANAEPVGE
jgi:hypothetical protein